MPRPTLFDHPKFQRLAYMLGQPRPHILGYLEFIWRVGNSSGNEVIGDEIDVELAAEWTGERGALVKALLDPSVRMLDRLADGRLAIHDFHDHAPRYVQDRWRKEQERKEKSTARTRRRKMGPAADTRRTHGGPAEPVSDLGAQPSSTPTHAHTPAPAPAPSHSQDLRARETTNHGGSYRPVNPMDPPDMPLDESFEAFWALYPNHDKRTLAEGAWATLRPNGELLVRIMAALAWQVPMWKSQPPRFTPQAVNYLQQSRWRDEPPAPQVDESEAALERVLAGKGQLQ